LHRKASLMTGQLDCVCASVTSASGHYRQCGK
jgi:hypothetical protein